MKFKFITFWLLLATSITLTASCPSKESLAPQNEHCLCYCSDACGPRKNDKPGDSPFVDEETGVCFCKLRDKLNYFPNGCHLKPKSDKVNCCKK